MSGALHSRAFLPKASIAASQTASGSTRRLDNVFPMTWVGPGQSAQVGTFDLTGALVYIGWPSAQRLGRPEPSLIDLSRPIGRFPDLSISTSFSMKSYVDLAPGDRTAYLAWLEQDWGERDAYYPFIQLLVSGIERRLFVDILKDSALRWEIPFIRAAVAAMSKHFSRMDFYGTFNSLLETIDILAADPLDPSFTPPVPRDVHWRVPNILKLTLGSFVAQRKPIPVEWAFSWASFRSDIPLRTPPRRCPDEYREMFMRMYREEYGQGMMVREGKSKLRIIYNPVNSSVGSFSLNIGSLPDVFMRSGPGKMLQYVSSRASSSLDGYSRWIGQHPEAAGTPASLAYLPPELVTESRPEVRKLESWMGGKLGAEARMRIPASEVIAFWGTSALATKLTPRELLSLVEVTGRFGFGIEPDPRFGRAPVEAGRHVVLFRSDNPILGHASDDLVIASVAVRFAAAVRAIDAPLDGGAVASLGKDLAGLLPLEAEEMARIRAQILLLEGQDTRLTGMKSQIDALAPSQRERVGAIVVAIAAQARDVSPAVVTLVMKIFRQLDLDRERVTGDLHVAMTSSPSSGSSRSGTRSTTRRIALDRRQIAATVRESSVVSDLLGRIFAEDDLPPVPVSALVPLEERVAGLDITHTALLQDLGLRKTWSAEEFATLAATYHVLASGAIDTLNEVALDLTGDLLIEGIDPLTIDPDILQELCS